MESIPETGYGKTGESAKKSRKNDPGLQGFELRAKVEKLWANRVFNYTLFHAIPF